MNMDILLILLGGGVDIIVLIVGDYFNGNDVLIFKGEGGIVDFVGMFVNFVELFVLYYLLVCVFDSVGLEEVDLDGVINILDVDMIVVYFISDVKVVVIWNLLVFEIVGLFLDVNVLFDSVDILGEILDLMVVNIEMFVDNFVFGMVVVGVWYEVMILMVVGDEEVLIVMVEVLGIDLEGYKVQFVVIEMFFDLVVVVV